MTSGMSDEEQENLNKQIAEREKRTQREPGDYANWLRLSELYEKARRYEDMQDARQKCKEARLAAKSKMTGGHEAITRLRAFAEKEARKGRSKRDVLGHLLAEGLPPRMATDVVNQAFADAEKQPWYREKVLALPLFISGLLSWGMLALGLPGWCNVVFLVGGFFLIFLGFEQLEWYPKRIRKK